MRFDILPLVGVQAENGWSLRLGTTLAEARVALGAIGEVRPALSGFLSWRGDEGVTTFARAEDPGSDKVTCVELSDSDKDEVFLSGLEIFGPPTTVLAELSSALA